MENLDFSEEEIQEQLALLGYKNIPKHRLLEFKQDLDELLRHGQWTNVAPATLSTKTPTATTHSSPPAYTKEKVSASYFEDSGKGFFLHAQRTNHERKPLSTQENRNHGAQHGCYESYAQHSVAPKLQLCPGAPNRLQAEPDTEDTLDSLLSDSYTSTSDLQERRFIKRKVLRKHKGQSLVCDESVYSEGSAICLRLTHTAHLKSFHMYNMYNTQWDEDTDDDKKSLNSSFWSDGDGGEEEEEEVIDSKPVTPPFGALQGISGEKTQELNSQMSFTGEVLEGSNNNEVSSCGSPAPSLMTSGYGTLRAEEQEVGDHRDGHTVTEFDQDSRADLSEMKDDDEDCPSFCSFGELDSEAPHEPDVSGSSVCSTESSTLVVVDTVRCGSDALEEINISDTKPERKDEEQTEEEEHGYEVTKSTLAEHHLHIDASRDTSGQTGVEEGADVTECGKQEELQTLTELSVTEDRVQTGDDEEEDASRNNISSTDSKLEFSWMTHGKMEVDWQENLRHGKDVASCLEEQMAELDLSTAAQKDFETESEDVTGQSETQSFDTDGVSLSAFESYTRGMTRSQSDGDVRPKPKSFIRPVLSQPTIKKTDPVAKYFQYKQIWDMFKLPGESDRKALRWEIKERLAYQPPPPKPRRVYVPNTYTVPTEKKRSALRWQIRNDLANGLLPHRFNHQF